ncbi:MAG: hypothetical protein BWX50_01362 [Euryarchaeota archaeon ADurb.Bin009]|nr:MAG: hypothetical protein BWX50_01362 [Euryarchaeota archaeon ADurb.Bin009]
MHRRPGPGGILDRVVDRIPGGTVDPDVRVDSGVVEDVDREDVVRVALLSGRFIPEDRTVKRHLPGVPPLARMPEDVDRPAGRGVEFLEGGGKIVEPERERRDDDVVGLDVSPDRRILPAFPETGVVREPLCGHPLPEDGEHALGRVKGRDVGGGPGNRHGEPPRPGTHVEHGLAGLYPKDREFLLGCRSLIAGDPAVGGGAFVPVSGGIAVFLGTFRRTHVERFPELVPVDDPVHGCSFPCNRISCLFFTGSYLRQNDSRQAALPVTPSSDPCRSRGRRAR